MRHELAAAREQTERCPLCGGPLDLVPNCQIEQTLIKANHIRGRRATTTRIIVARVAFCCQCEFSEIR